MDPDQAILLYVKNLVQIYSYRLKESYIFIDLDEDLIVPGDVFCRLKRPSSYTKYEISPFFLIVGWRWGFFGSCFKDPEHIKKDRRNFKVFLFNIEVTKSKQALLKQLEH